MVFCGKKHGFPVAWFFKSSPHHDRRSKVPVPHHIACVSRFSTPHTFTPSENQQAFRRGVEHRHPVYDPPLTLPLRARAGLFREPLRARSSHTTLFWHSFGSQSWALWEPFTSIVIPYDPPRCHPFCGDRPGRALWEPLHRTSSSHTTLRWHSFPEPGWALWEPLFYSAILYDLTA